MALKSLGERVHCINTIANHRTHAFAAFLDVGLYGRLAIHTNLGVTRVSISHKQSHQVKDVRAQNHQILTAATRVFLSAATEFNNLAQASLTDEIAHALKLGAITSLMSNR